jgi:hypothetical protein
MAKIFNISINLVYILTVLLISQIEFILIISTIQMIILICWYLNIYKQKIIYPLRGWFKIES